MFNIKSISDAQSADVELKDPVSGTALGATITLAGPEHPKRKAIEFARQRKVRAKFQKAGKLEFTDPADDEQDNIELLAACTLGWSGITEDDGKEIVFSSNRSLDFRLYLKNADGSGSEQEIARAGADAFNSLDWSHDGKYILARRRNELWYLTMPERELKPLLQGWVVKGAQFSPDGRWVAYASNESGNMEIYVAPFPSANGKWQVSTGGGQEPRWRKDGKELFYLALDSRLMAAPVTAGASFASGSPVALFQTHRRQPISSQDTYSYDVSADGQRFLIATQVDESAAPLSVFLNWTSAMEK